MRPFFHFLALCAVLLPLHAFSQPNVLGLPAVPQTPLPESPPAGGAASPKAGASAAQPQVSDSDMKAVLNGGVTMASSYTSTLATVRVTTHTLYQGDALRKQALSAARLVQRDLRLACGKQCKPSSMGAPKLLPDGKLQFDLVIDGLPRALNNDDMMNLLLGRPLVVAAATAKPSPQVAPPARAAASAAAGVPVAREPSSMPESVQMTRTLVEGSPAPAEPAK